MQDIAGKLKSITAEQLGVKPEKITDQARFVDELGADSLDVTELVMSFEEQYDIEIPDKDVKELTTVSEAVEYIKKKVALK